MTPHPQANYSLWKFIRTNEVGWKVLFAAVLILYFVVVRGIRGDGLWYIDVFLGLLTVAAVIRDVRIRKRLRKLNARDTNPLNHHVDLWDAAPYNCIHGVKPDKHTHECAWPIMHDGIPMPTLKERKIQVKI